MNSRQLMAMAFPCARVEQTLLERFVQDHYYHGRANRSWRSILTINR